MNTTIRRAVKEDCVSMLALIHELAVFERAPEEVTVTIGHFTESGFGTSPVWWAFVAEENNTIIGFALYYIRYSTWKGQRLYLEDFIVTEAARGKGVGTLLFDRIIEEAKEKHLNGVVLQVLDWNEPAIRFYKKYNAYIESGWLNAIISW